MAMLFLLPADRPLRALQSHEFSCCIANGARLAHCASVEETLFRQLTCDLFWLRHVHRRHITYSTSAATLPFSPITLNSVAEVHARTPYCSNEWHSPPSDNAPESEQCRWGRAEQRSVRGEVEAGTEG